MAVLDSECNKVFEDIALSFLIEQYEASEDIFTLPLSPGIGAATR